VKIGQVLTIAVVVLAPACLSPHLLPSAYLAISATGATGRRFLGESYPGEMQVAYLAVARSHAVDLLRKRARQSVLGHDEAATAVEARGDAMVGQFPPVYNGRT
jgi:hypothetical protein